MQHYSVCSPRLIPFFAIWFLSEMNSRSLSLFRVSFPLFSFTWTNFWDPIPNDDAFSSPKCLGPPTSAARYYMMQKWFEGVHALGGKRDGEGRWGSYNYGSPFFPIRKNTFLFLSFTISNTQELFFIKVTYFKLQRNRNDTWIEHLVEVERLRAGGALCMV